MTLPTVSFEFFPPKNLAGSFRLWDTLQVLAPFEPGFVSVTYGTGGTTRALTHEAVTAIQQKAGLRVAAHLTCVDATRSEILDIAQSYKAAGITDIVALRGDAPGPNAGGFSPAPNGFASAIELTRALKDAGDFTIRVGAYPDGHKDASCMAQNIDHLKAKFDAGADEAITQFFFEPDSFLRFRDACAAAGITQKIVPGILPIENWEGAKRFAQRCGAPLPRWLDDAFTKAIRDDRQDLLATALATELCSTLTQNGVDHLHFYTLNRPELTRDICTALGLSARAPLAQVA
jgi:methylenetetrahydrofolate reductase (NADPH)